jgi:hypothetical protein
MAQDNKYNGWTNYATWRINLEIIDGMEFDGYSDNVWDLAEQIRDYVYEILSYDQKDTLVLDYAYAFINEVDWREIAESVINNREQEAQSLEDYDETV